MSTLSPPISSFAQQSTPMHWGFRGFGYLFDTALIPCLLIAFVLLALSVITWAILTAKFSQIAKVAERNERFEFAFRKSSSVLDPFETKFSVPDSPLYAVYLAGCREALFQLLGDRNPDGPLLEQVHNAQPLIPEQMRPIRAEMERAVGESTLILERKMGFLASVISGAPCLGLLGTLWGIMAVFAGMALAETTPTIQNLAPGIASALVTTILALVVATPALFTFNFLVNRLRSLILEAQNFAAELGSTLERHFVRYPSPGSHSVREDAVSNPPPLASMGTPNRDLDAATSTQSPFWQSGQPASQTEEHELGPAVNPIAEKARQRRPVP